MNKDAPARGRPGKGHKAGKDECSATAPPQALAAVPPTPTISTRPASVAAGVIS